MHHKSLRPVSLLSGVIIALIIAIWIGWPVSVRFENPLFNYYYVIFVCGLLPLIVALNLRWGRSLPTIVNNLAIVALISAPILPVATIASWDAEDIKQKGHDASFELIDGLSVDQKNYRLYRTNGGATTAFGLVLRRESKPLLGVKIVSVIYSEYEARSGQLHRDENKQIFLLIGPYSEKKPAHRVPIDTDA